ncbi:uncharacterized protein LOC141900418 [Tubulanus polymorphus]|uniref:uncharacterized protein LOC141900418 n=1 Tax=Tubulanus polymorphus TaxID=672921 RepID=UPI003DA44524
MPDCFRCVVCTKIFEKACSLKQHLQEIHKIDAEALAFVATTSVNSQLETTGDPTSVFPDKAMQLQIEKRSLQLILKHKDAHFRSIQQIERFQKNVLIRKLKEAEKQVEALEKQLASRSIHPAVKHEKFD